MSKRRSQEPVAIRQQRVHNAIQAVGGYWRPLAGVVRLLEEVGELSELLDYARNGSHLQAVAEEMADIWIITTCTANQFNIRLEEFSSGELSPEGEGNTTFFEMVAQAGRIARIINYYDGPKNPRTIDPWPSLFDVWPMLGPTIASLHTYLYRLAAQYRISLDRAIDAKIKEIAVLDQGRYQRSYDPSTADSLGEFEEVRRHTSCPYAEDASLWGAPSWAPEKSMADNADRLYPYLLSFAKAAPNEHIDGFVISVNDRSLQRDMHCLSSWFRELLEALAALDPKPNSLHEGLIARRGWQFSFFDVRMFISVFSPLYDERHVRHSDTRTFVVFQPETSFDNHGIGSRFADSLARKREVRLRFARKGIPYPSDIIDCRIEAALYLLPRWIGDGDVIWWQKSPKQEPG